MQMTCWRCFNNHHGKGLTFSGNLPPKSDSDLATSDNLFELLATRWTMLEMAHQTRIAQRRATHNRFASAGRG